MVALGALAQATLGTTTVVAGLPVTATSPASMVVNVGSGMIAALEPMEANAYGSLSADTTDSIVKMGVNSVGVTPFTLTAPGTSGQSINYLIEAAFVETDAGSTVLPYYNAGNPTEPYAGPTNAGTSQNTLRTQRVGLTLKAGTAATTGTQTTPSVDVGNVALAVITVAYGATTVVAGNISVAPGSPLIDGQGSGRGIQPGRRLPVAPTVITTAGSGNINVPSGATAAEIEVWGGGGGSENSASGNPSAGGAGGGYSKKYVMGLTPGSLIPYVCGAGGPIGAASPGGTTSVGSGPYLQATGGFVNPLGGVNGNLPGVGSGGDDNLTGQQGGNAYGNAGGFGGAAPRGSGGSTNAGGVGQPGAAYGAVASGAGTGAGGTSALTGALGATGAISIRWLT